MIILGKHSTSRTPHELKYDADGNLLSDDAQEYAWDSASRLAAAYSGNACVLSNAYDHLSRRAMKIPPAAGGIGGLVAVSLDGELYLPLSDSNGNITEFIDTNGAIVAQYRYETFGDTLAESGAMSGAFPFRFSTKYFDPEIGFMHCTLLFNWGPISVKTTSN